MGAPHRLCPTMSSRKLQALDFIKRYFAEWGQSPTLGEISAALGVSTKRAHDLVSQLARDGLIAVMGGQTRGIRLLHPALELSEADVLVLLASRGWTIANGGQTLQPPDDVDPLRATAEALTEKGLPGIPHLDHHGDEDGGGDGDAHGESEKDQDAA